MSIAHEPTSIEDREDKVEEIKERIAQLDHEFAGTVMSDNARSEWNDLNGDLDAHTQAIRELRSRRERVQALAGNPAATETAGTKPAQAPAFHKRKGDDIYDVRQIRAGSSSDEEYRDNLMDNAKRAIERAPFTRHAGDKDVVKGHVTELLERLDKNGDLAYRFLVTGSPAYDRAFGKMVLGQQYQLTPEEGRAMALVPGSAGGLAAPYHLDPTVIITNDGSTSPLRQIARVEQTYTKTWQGITSSGITVSRSGEAEEADDNSFSVAQPEVSPTRVIADVRFSVEVDQDWPQLRGEIGRLLADAKDREEDHAFVRGTGEDDQPYGVVQTLNSDSYVDLESSGDLTVMDLYNLEAELPVRFRDRGHFLANKSTYQDVRDLGTASDGGALWVRLASGQPSELLGYPAHEASAMQSIDSGGPGANRFLLFGDFSEFLIVDRVGMTVEVNQHVTGSNGRWTGQRSIVAAWRNSSRILADNAFRVLVNNGS